MSTISIIETSNHATNELNIYQTFFPAVKKADNILVREYGVMIYINQPLTTAVYTFAKTDYDRYVKDNRNLFPVFNIHTPQQEILDFMQLNNISVNITEQVDYNVSGLTNITLTFR